LPELSKRLWLYIILVTAVGTVLLAHWTYNIILSCNIILSWEVLRGFLFWAALDIIAELTPVALPQGGFVTLGFPVIYASLLVYGPGVSSWIVVVCNTIVEAKLRGRKQYMGGIAITADSIGHILPIVSSALAYFLVNTFLVNIILALQKKTSILEMWLVNFKWTVPNYLAQTPIGFLMAVLYRGISWWAVLFLCFPLFIAYYAYRLYVDLRKQHLSTIQALATAIEARDAYTEDHSMRMSQYAVATARELGVSINEVEIIHYAAILHDIGKIGVSDRILNKPGKLTKKELTEMRKHPKTGRDIISKIDSLKKASRLVYYHHERYNGQGYPEGLKGEDIPVGARILAVIDAYDAMTSKRPYRSAYSTKEAIRELKENAGTQFDKKVVEAFLKVLKSNQNVT